MYFEEVLTLFDIFHNEEQKAVYWTEWDFFPDNKTALWPDYDLLMFLLLLLLGS